MSESSFSGTPDPANRGSANVTSFVDRRNHTVLAVGRFTQLFRGYFDHATGLGLLPEGDALPMMRLALPSAALQLALLPPDQFCSWTYNFIEPPLNIFVTGDNNKLWLTGRIFVENIKTAPRNRLYVESQRPKLEPSKSIVDFDGPDILGALEEYYQRSLQMRSRIFQLDNQDELLLIQGLPNVDREWFSELDVGVLRQLLEEDVEKIEDRTYLFNCGCDLQQISLVIQELFGTNPDQLFGDEKEVEVQCPRCGRYWKLDRSIFDRVDA